MEDGSVAAVLAQEDAEESPQAPDKPQLDSPQSELAEAEAPHPELFAGAAGAGVGVGGGVAVGFGVPQEATGGVLVVGAERAG